MVLSHLDYCCVAYLDLSEELRLQIQRLQNSCVRYVTGVGRNQHITPSRRQLGWLKTDTRRMYFSSILIYKILRIGQPLYQPRGPSRGEVKELSVPSFRTETGRWSFQVYCSSFWNSLPARIRYAPSLNNFKFRLRSHLFEVDLL